MRQFLGGKAHNADDARVVSLNEIYKYDKMIVKLTDMTCGCYASRKNEKNKWTLLKR